MSGAAQDVGQETNGPGAAGSDAPGLAPPVEAQAIRARRPETVAFRRAAVAVAAAPADSDEARISAVEAGTHLVALAAADDDAALRAILRPDPEIEAVAWTVACYQIGDLTPSALRDFADPVEAVAVLGSCEDASHLAAELTASTDSGLRWTAMTRSGDVARWQPVGATTCSGDAEGVHLAEVSGRWKDQLLRWAAAPDHDLVPEPQVAQPVDVASGTEPTVEVARVEGPEGGSALSSFLHPEAVGEIVRRVADVVREIDHAVSPPDPEILTRLAAIEVRLDELQRSVSALHAAVDQTGGPQWLRRLLRVRAMVAVEVQRHAASSD